jgi:regulator of PEP synthase PpsR (kinase-PPPase family)
MADAASGGRGRVEVFVVSDGTGTTVTGAVRAAMLQFDTPWRLRTFAEIRNESQLPRVIEQAEKAAALIVFSLVNQRLARILETRSAERGIPTVDLLGPLIARVASHLREEPRHRPGLLHGVSDEYFRRVEAVEFAVRHDDGANLHTLFRADIVLTGVSRTSKTPLSMYLAQRGYKAGNVPLIPGLEPPRELLDIDPRKVFGLLMDPAILVSVRRTRMRSVGGVPYADYASPDAIADELQHARRLFRERGWRSVDITGRAVEEAATRILELVEA